MSVTKLGDKIRVYGSMYGIVKYIDGSVAHVEVPSGKIVLVRVPEMERMFNTRKDSDFRVGDIVQGAVFGTFEILEIKDKGYGNIQYRCKMISNENIEKTGSTLRIGDMILYCADVLCWKRE